MSNAQNLLLVFSCSFFSLKGKCSSKVWCHSSDRQLGLTLVGLRKSHNSGVFVHGYSVSRCLIWHSADTRLFGFVTFCGPAAPVPPIVPEFSIFGLKWDSLNLCEGHCLLSLESYKLTNIQVFLVCVSQFLKEHHHSRGANFTLPFQYFKSFSLWSWEEIKKSKVNRYLGLTFNCSDMQSLNDNKKKKEQGPIISFISPALCPKWHVLNSSNLIYRVK